MSSCPHVESRLSRCQNYHGQEESDLGKWRPRNHYTIENKRKQPKKQAKEQGLELFHKPGQPETDETDAKPQKKDKTEEGTEKKKKKKKIIEEQVRGLSRKKKRKKLMLLEEQRDREKEEKLEGKKFKKKKIGQYASHSRITEKGFGCWSTSQSPTTEEI